MPELDRQGLEDEFNLIEEEPIVLEPIDENEPDEFELEWETENDAGETLRKNVERANTILDQIQEEMANGNFSARMVEVAGNIINAITTASKVIIDDSNYNKYLDIRKSLVLLKQREVDIKERKGRIPQSNNNLIIASREDVLKLINDKSQNKLNS